MLFNVTPSNKSSCHVTSTDIPDPLSPLLPIVHRLWQVFRATSHILTELLYVCLRWPSCFCLAICGSPYETSSLMSLSLLLQQCPACLVIPIYNKTNLFCNQNSINIFNWFFCTKFCLLLIKQRRFLDICC